MWILSFIWYVECYEIQFIFKLLFLGTTEAYDGTGRWDFLHSDHFSFIPSLSVVYKPGSSHQTTKKWQKYGSHLNARQNNSCSISIKEYSRIFFIPL